MANARRRSTIVNYQHKWKKFRQWCGQRGHTVSRPSSSKFADFLLHLRRTCGLSVSAVKGYKSMLNSVFSLKGFDLAEDPVLKNLVKAFEVEVPRVRVRAPTWNLDVVLKALTLPPFEPLVSSSFRELTKKTLFLLALATAKRVGELQALAHSFVWQGGDAILSYLPEFVAKTETLLNPLPREFRLKSLSGILGNGDEELLLCPVRALRIFRERTMDLRPRPRTLFVSLRDRSKPLSKNALSYLLKETILHSHRELGEDHFPVMRVKAHDIRGVATSLNLWRNKSFSVILDAASWKTPSVFANHYLRDVERVDGDTFSLGPIVAGGGVVT